MAPCVARPLPTHEDLDNEGNLERRIDLPVSTSWPHAKDEGTLLVVISKNRKPALCRAHCVIHVRAACDVLGLSRRVTVLHLSSNSHCELINRHRVAAPDLNVKLVWLIDAAVSQLRLFERHEVAEPSNRAKQELEVGPALKAILVSV